MRDFSTDQQFVVLQLLDFKVAMGEEVDRLYSEMLVARSDLGTRSSEYVLARDKYDRTFYQWLGISKALDHLDPFQERASFLSPHHSKESVL